MREIKFRAWDNVNKRMGYFLKGFVWCDEYYTWNLSPDGGSIMDVPPGENIDFMQYTGLHDKNGREVYEGDIISSIGERCKRIFKISFDTVYDDDGLSWPCFTMPISEYGDETYEVIGNIHESPELLKGPQ